MKPLDDPKFSRDDLRDWMVAYLARLLDMEPAEIDPGCSFELYGLDSSGAVGLSGDLEDLLGTTFDTSLVYDYPTIDALLDHLQSLALVRAA